MRITRIIRPLLCLALSLAAVHPAAADDNDGGRALRDGARILDEAFADAFVANDIDAAVALYADDAVLFNIGGPPAVGRDAIRAALAGFFAAFEVKGFQHTEQHYTTEDDLSTGWALFAITVAPRGGGPTFVISGRSTTVARRSHGQWRYLHDHASLPQP